MQVLLLTLFDVIEPVHFRHALLQLLPEEIHHGLFDLALHVLVFEEIYGREHFRKGLQTCSQHYDHLRDVQIRLLAQVK